VSRATQTRPECVPGRLPELGSLAGSFCRCALTGHLFLPESRAVLAVGRKKIRIEKISDERNRQVRL